MRAFTIEFWGLKMLDMMKRIPLGLKADLRESIADFSQVVSGFGMEGIGKRILAQRVYNQTRISKYTDRVAISEQPRMWIQCHEDEENYQHFNFGGKDSSERMLQSIKLRQT
ncbi:uncharacterized protein LOC132293193 [Cornus florida]|uniref:uncharacterized protein LOC132293193 n=1 Tax=Cornus florida TaxID=4283 RepID=UPI00289768F4|nr:uncharacterized protein LOC132293193 [Cornus florida]